RRAQHRPRRRGGHRARQLRGRGARPDGGARRRRRLGRRCGAQPTGRGRAGGAVRAAAHRRHPHPRPARGARGDRRPRAGDPGVVGRTRRGTGPGTTDRPGGRPRLRGAPMTAALLLVIAALAVWPVRRPAHRLAGRDRAGTGAPNPGTETVAAHRAPHLRLRRLGAAAAGGAAVLGALTVGPNTAAIVGLITAIAAHRLARRRSAARARDRTDAVLTAVDAVLGEVRAGAHPATACAAAGADGGHGAVPEAFARAAATAALGGTVAESLTESAHRIPDLAAPAAAWRLAEQHGLGMADLLETVRDDLTARRDHARRIDAGMAGARATAAV